MDRDRSGISVPPRQPAPSIPPRQPAPAFIEKIRRDESTGSLERMATDPMIPTRIPTIAHPQPVGEPAAMPVPGTTPDPVHTPHVARRPPYTGWRRAVHHMSAGAIDPGRSTDDLYHESLLDRIRQPLGSDYRIAVLSLKGGVGKTTTTVGLGSAFAAERDDRVIAVDANPDLGTLTQRIPARTGSTVRDLLRGGPYQYYSQVRAYTAQAATGLEVLGGERDPAISEAFDETEYRDVIGLLQRFYNIILTDCGTGLMHSAMRGTLGVSHTLVLVSSPALDGARSAAATLDWLELHGYAHLIRHAVVVISSARPGNPNIHIEQLRRYFLGRCRAVHVIPFDWHLCVGDGIDPVAMHPRTRRAYLELAATIADDFTAGLSRYAKLR
ncbi:MinD/ParA family protein [Skermania piniformis]|uniref:MinD/ParA family protein n=1 Tax=Skermania pinensis TaxID=39122 RepID=A0ABX8SBA1_9ACTN|nr:MinD/ParA family protein [Skermania piniformis]QXQ14601.1 MinD/ParA family protein [Skermania piniformis]